MRAALALALFLALAACAPLPPPTREAIADWKSGKPDADCEIRGESGQWRADYCMLETQTDDLIAAQPCMDREARRRKGEECTLRRYYKREWCRALVASRSLPHSYAECIADPELAGKIVKGADLESLQ